MKDLKDMQPLNSNEDYLYGVNARLEVLIDSVNKLSKVVENSIKPVEVKKEEANKIEPIKEVKKEIKKEEVKEEVKPKKKKASTKK